LNTQEYLANGSFAVNSMDNYLEVCVGDLPSFISLCMTLRLPEANPQKFWSFRGQRNSTWGLGIENRFHNINEQEIDKCLEQFKKRCKEFHQPAYILENESWNWLFFAQHHGLQTRLLDWSSNPLVALYFAVENIISNGVDEDGVQNCGVVWALKVNNEHFVSSNALKYQHPDNIKIWMMIDPPPITSRIARQSGKFSIHPPGCKNIDITERRKHEEELVKIVLKKDTETNVAKGIRQQLGIMNIHHAYLFPDIDGVAQFINHEWPAIALRQ
jgi:hypothetical protein